MITPRFPLGPIREAHGHYRLAATTGAMAAGAATRLFFYARWASTAKRMVLTELTLDGLFASTAFAAGQILIAAYIARGFTAENGAPGGSSLLPTGDLNKLRTAMSTTALTALRIATTASLAAPTYTLDTQPFGQINTHSSGGWNSATPIIGSIYLPKTDLFRAAPTNEYPIVLGANEGIAIQATVPATGVWTAGVTMRWAEVQKYENP